MRPTAPAPPSSSPLTADRAGRVPEPSRIRDFLRRRTGRPGPPNSGILWNDPSRGYCGWFEGGWGAWHELSVRTFADGATGHVTVTLDGSVVPGLDLVENIGTDPIGRITLGDETNSDVYSAAYDDFAVTG